MTAERGQKPVPGRARLRAAGVGDWPRIGELTGGAVAEDAPGTTLVAVLEDAIIGAVNFATEDGAGRIIALCVDPAHRRQGIAVRLMRRAEGIMRGRGAERAVVSCPEGAVAALVAMGYEEGAVELEKPLAGDWRNFYGRRHGKTLRVSQRVALSRLAGLSPGAVTLRDNPERHKLDLPRFDGGPIWLEVGFGGGEHLVHQAAQNPGVHIIGAEPFVNGVAMLLAKLDRAGVTNVSVHPGDARDLIEVLPDGAISKAFLLYPDPWHKRRHHRRRFVTPDYLGPLARVMARGAEFRIATDIPDYVRQTREEVPKAGFRDETADDAVAWPDWIRTRYEAKAVREGRRPHYLTYRRG